MTCGLRSDSEQSSLARFSSSLMQLIVNHTLFCLSPLLLRLHTNELKKKKEEAFQTFVRLYFHALVHALTPLGMHVNTHKHTNMKKQPLKLLVKMGRWLAD